LLTRDAVGLLASFSAFFLAGLFLQNPILVGMGVVSLTFLILGSSIAQPKLIVLERRGGDTGVFVNDELADEVEVRIKDGIGIVTAACTIPQEFELVDGNNFLAVWKGRGEKTASIAYRMRCTRRGIYQLPGPGWESRHPLRLRQTTFGSGEARTITVKPRLLDVRKVRSFATASRIPVPAGALMKVGPPTMDFRELRPYARGDPFKHINWKATAKAISRGSPLPIVNEYEREGRQLVWIFIDSSPSMLLGTSISNPLEHGLEAVHGLAHYYLKRGCAVGLCVYGGKKIRVLYPDTGSRQYWRILDEILNLRVEEREEPETRSGPEGCREEATGETEPGHAKRTDLRAAVEACRRYLLGRGPLCVVVSRFTVGSLDSLAEGLGELSKYCGGHGKRASLMVINVIGYDLATRQPLAAEVLRARDRLARRKVKGFLRWVDWNPRRESFTAALLRGVA